MGLFKPDATPQDVVAWAEKEFQKAHDARLTFERQWLLNLAFYYGKQWVTWGPEVSNSRRLSTPRAPRWRVRLTVNKIQPYVRRETARLSSQKPRGFVVPTSSDEADRSAARVANSVVEFLNEDLQLDAIHDLCDWWTCVAGSGYYKVRYTQDEIDTRTTQPGKLVVDVIRPFDIYVPDIEETRIREQAWVCQAQSIPVDKIHEVWGVDVVSDADISEVDQRVRSVMSIFNQNKGEDHAVVKEFWIKPCRNFPEGLVFVVCNGKLLPFAAPEPVEELDPDGNPLPPMEDEYPKPEGTIEWPYGHGRLPFIQRGHTLSGRFYDTTFVEQLISLQREYNRSRSQIVENKNLTSRPQWAVPTGAVDKDQLTTEPGAVISYQFGMQPPTPIQPPMLPNYVIEHVKLAAAEMDEIASQNEVSKGSVPPGVEAATAISYLQERDDAALTYAVHSKERAVQEINQQLLSLVTEFWDQPRLVRVVGMNEVFDTQQLRGTDLRDNTDYRVVSGSSAPVSRAAKKAEILELTKAGGIPWNHTLRMIDLPDVAALVEEVERDTVQATRENLQLSKGMFPPVEIWHDHVAHIEEHDSYKKREEYEHLDDQTKAMFRFHDYIHLMQMAMILGIPFQEDPNVQAARMGDPATGEPPVDPFAVDPMAEMELRKILVMFKAGGAPQPVGSGTPA